MEALPNDDHNQKINRLAILEQIKRLHSEVDGSVLECWRKNLPKMIMLGEALDTLKRDVEQGKWLEWYRANAGYCGFSEDTAERYMRLYRNRQLLEQPDSAHVRNLTDALILIKEPDPDKRKALLDEAARTGKSIRSAKKRVKKGQKQFSDPKRTAATDGLCALGIEYEVAAQWAEVAEGETVEDLIKDALRRRTLALEVSKDASEVQDQELYSIQTLEGVTVYFTEDEYYKIDYNLDGHGEPVSIAKQPQTLRVVEDDLGVQCQWVLAPKTPVKLQETATADPDLVGHAEPLVPVNHPPAAPEFVSESQTAVQASNEQSFALKDYVYLITKNNPPVTSLMWAFDEFYRALMTTHLSFGDKDLLHKHIRKATESKYP